MSAKRILAVVLGGSALFALMIALAARTDTPQTATQFEESWRESAGPVLLKAASLMDTGPKSIRTEVIRLDPDPGFVVLEEEQLTYEPKQQRRVKLDVCQRHKMHKVYHGKSWRCKH